MMMMHYNRNANRVLRPEELHDHDDDDEDDDAAADDDDDGDDDDGSLRGRQ